MAGSLVELLGWRRSRWLLAAPTVAWGLWACTSHPLETPTPEPQQQTNQRYSVTTTREDVDILFMIDDSGSMANKQDNLRNNFPTFMQVLQNIPGGLPNVRIAVVDSDLGAGGVKTANACAGKGDAGRFWITDTKGVNCGIADGRQFIESSGGNATSNLAAGMTLEQVFSCMAARGTKGCGFEHQLQAANLALHPKAGWNPGNDGFLRPAAYLAIILLTDEDDCSGPDDAAAFYSQTPPAGTIPNYLCSAEGHLCGGAAPPPMDFSAPLAGCSATPSGQLIAVQQIVNDIKGLKAAPDNKIIVAAITGKPDPGQENTAQYRIAKSGGNGGGFDTAQICTGSGGGKPAIRIKTFIDAFKYGTLETICQDNFGAALGKIAQLVGSVVGSGSSCLDAKLADMDRAKAGVQPDCQVIDQVTDKVTGQVVETPLPECGATGTKPCWTLTADAGCTASGYKVTTDRGGKPEPAGLKQEFKCFTCTRPGTPGC